MWNNHYHKQFTAKTVEDLTMKVMGWDLTKPVNPDKPFNESQLLDSWFEPTMLTADTYLKETIKGRVEGWVPMNYLTRNATVRKLDVKIDRPVQVLPYKTQYTPPDVPLALAIGTAVAPTFAAHPTGTAIWSLERLDALFGQVRQVVSIGRAVSNLTGEFWVDYVGYGNPMKWDEGFSLFPEGQAILRPGTFFRKPDIGFVAGTAFVFSTRDMKAGGITQITAPGSATSGTSMLTYCTALDWWPHTAPIIDGIDGIDATTWYLTYGVGWNDGK